MLTLSGEFPSFSGPSVALPYQTTVVGCSLCLLCSKRMSIYFISVEAFTVPTSNSQMILSECRSRIVLDFYNSYTVFRETYTATTTVPENLRYDTGRRGNDCSHSAIPSSTK